jgi:acetolactate synthase-1/2/3 large subunit
MQPGTATRNTAEEFLRLLASRGVDYFFVNSGTDFPSMEEALALAREQGFDIPRTLLVPHENVAVGMAYGVTLVTGQPQAVMVHVNVGTANAMCGLINASRENIPMLMAAGRTPWFEQGASSSRSLNIHWAQDMFDQGGMVREHVKWDHELRSGAQVEAVVDRALAIACAEPQGPVYLSLPREVLAQDSPPSQAHTTQSPAPPCMPDAASIAQVARDLARARNPLIITARAGKQPQAVALLGALAQAWATPVVEFRPRYLSLPGNHPMHGGYEVNPWLDDADYILVLDCDVPWIPQQKVPGAHARVVHVGSDPLFARYPIRGFRADQTIAASPLAFLEALTVAMAGQQPDANALAARRNRVAQAGEQRRRTLQQQIQAGQTAATMSMVAVSAAVGDALARHGDDAVVVNEYSLVPAAVRLTQPGSYYGSSPVGGLGWGVPAAMGVKLARPETLVIATVGDGSYTFTNPLACHHAAAMHGTPVLTIVMNNSGYGAVDRATRAMYPQGRAATQGMSLVSLEPMPRYEDVIKACGGWGERVERYGDLASVLDQAIYQVQAEGRQALVNVMCS